MGAYLDRIYRIYRMGQAICILFILFILSINPDNEIPMFENISLNGYVTHTMLKKTKMAKPIDLGLVLDGKDAVDLTEMFVYTPFLQEQQ